MPGTTPLQESLLKGFNGFDDNNSFFAEKKKLSNNNDAQQNLVERIKKDIKEMLLIYAHSSGTFKIAGHHPFQALTSELAQKTDDLNPENLSELFKTMRSIQQSIRREYQAIFSPFTQSRLYNAIDMILERYDSNKLTGPSLW